MGVVCQIGAVLERRRNGVTVADETQVGCGGMHAVTESAGMQRVLVMVHATLHRARNKRVSDAEDLMCNHRRDDDRRMGDSGGGRR